MANVQELKPLGASLKLVGAQGRETLTVGPFEVFIAASKNPTMSFATPHAEVSAWSEATRELTRAFLLRGRQARLEYFHELYPALAVALEAAGFERDSAAPVMTLTPQLLAPPPAQTHGTYRRLRADEPERLQAFLEQQSVAYGNPGEDTLAWLPNLRLG